MSVYNGEKYLDEAIKSILDQSFSNFEFIIINDGSTDGTMKLLEYYKTKDSRIKLITRENKGLIYSLNEGLSIAKGKYIARMDADDISLSNRFDEQYYFLEKNGEVGVCGTWVEVFGDGIKTKRWVMPTNDNVLKSTLLYSVPFAHPTVMMRKSLVVKNNLRYNSNYKNAEDYKFWIDISKCTVFANVPKVLLRHRWHRESVTRQADSKEGEERFDIISKIQNEMLDIINIKLTDEERKVHYMLSLNERILSADSDKYLVKSYFSKLYEHVKKNKTDIQMNALLNIIARKYFIYFALSFWKKKDMSQMKIFDWIFWRGAHNILIDKSMRICTTLKSYSIKFKK